jgi:Cyclin M transmembrane N-terminal domain
MPTGDGSMADLFGIAAILVLVAANGFFVAAEFSLVAVRRSRIAQLVAVGRTNAAALQRAVDNLDANLAASQLGITISSLALGWIGEPALAHLIEPLFGGFTGSIAAVSSHAAAIAISFFIITVLHIVLGELAPKKPCAPAQRNDSARGRPTAWTVPLSALAGHHGAKRPGQPSPAALWTAPGQDRGIVALAGRIETADL